MKILVKLMSLCLVFVLVLSLGTTAFAACAVHDWDVAEANSNGHTWKCLSCGLTVGPQVHKFRDWEIREHNTETTDGYRVRWCDDCGFAEKDVIKAGAPYTGDESNIYLYSALSLLALMGLGGTAVLVKRREN